MLDRMRWKRFWVRFTYVLSKVGHISGHILVCDYGKSFGSTATKRHLMDTFTRIGYF